MALFGDSRHPLLSTDEGCTCLLLSESHPLSVLTGFQHWRQGLMLDRRLFLGG